MSTHERAQLNVYITHFCPQKTNQSYAARNGYLATSIFYLSQIKNYELSITIVSNIEISNFEELANPVRSRLDGSVIKQYIASREEISEEGVQLDWLLTWVHKSILRKDFVASKSESRDLFLVLEDDALFTEANIEYFLEEKLDLESIGLLPGYMRSEWSAGDLCWTHEDPLGRISKNSIKYAHPIDEGKTLMQLLNPFSASIILDYDLAKEYLASTSSIQQLACNKHPIIFDIGSTATLGLIMESVPKGYLNRVAVICNSENGFPIPGSVIRHLGDRYAKDKWHRNARLYDKENLGDLPTNRKLRDYLFRLARKDRVKVARSFFMKVRS